MFFRLKHLLFPHQTNNYKAKILHFSFLTTFVFFVCVFQIILSLIIQKHPGVLGFASNIVPEEIITITNKQREAKGLAPLKLSKSLIEVAKQKGADMFAKNYWAHNAPDGKTPWWFFKQVGYSYIYAGENLARDFGDSKSVVQAWMNSPSHRDNILSSRYDEIGIAVVDGILDGQETTLVIQEFGRPTSLAGPATSGINNQGGLMVSIPQVQPLVQLNQKTILSQAKQSYIDKIPLFSSFVLTKGVNTALGMIILLVLLIDVFVVWYKKIPRISGKSLAHFSFFAAVILVILLTGNGQIL